jgi:hypothetical protein
MLIILILECIYLFVCFYNALFCKVCNFVALNLFSLSLSPHVCDQLCSSGPNSTDIMGRFSHGRSWERPSVEANNLTGFYSHHHPPFMMAMQQSSNHNPYDFLEPSTAPTPQVSPTEQPSSSSAATETRVGSHFETIPPPFIDFLGVGAT